MNLREYIDSFPRGERKAVREQIATACDVTESAVKHWANGARGIHSKYFKSIVAVCDGAISIEDLICDSEAA